MLLWYTPVVVRVCARRNFAWTCNEQWTKKEVKSPPAMGLTGL